jgi:hypothetical protein
MSAVDQVKGIIEERGGIDHLVSRLSGQKDPLRPSKPTAKEDDGLEQYVWRMARFYSGADTSMPVTCAMDLQIFLDERDIQASVSGITDDEGKEITSYLDKVTTKVLTELGLSDKKAARAWKGTGLF